MDNRISEDFIEEVRQRVDIVEVISEYVVLKRAGKNYQGLCPFHSEKTPSFNVNPERQMFYCFGCHTGGNVFSFLMKKNNQTFPEVLQDVARRAGMELPEKELTQEEQRREAMHHRWQEIQELSARYFQEMLTEKPEGEPARKYLSGRGIDQDTIMKFRLGYALDSWDGLINEMAKHGITPDELSEAGLSVKKEQGEGKVSFYDRFRGRVIFTILDLHGKPIGFGGRVLDDSLPKYLNSPETQFFHKGRNLYGIQVASRGIREAGYSILLEGYMDVIAVQKAGILNALASLGTALTRDQAKILKRYSPKVVIGYDSDNAGVQAAIRAGEILINEGLNVRVLKLKGAKDPDEYLRGHSKEEFLQEVRNSLSYVEFKYDVLTSEAPPDTITSKAELIRRMAPDILRTGSAAEREGYARFLSLQLGLTLEAVKEEISGVDKKKLENKGYHEIFSQKQDISPEKSNTIYVANTRMTRDPIASGAYRAEQILLRLVLNDPGIKNEVQAKLGNEFWHLDEHRHIFGALPGNLSSPAGNEDLYARIQRRLAEIYELNIDETKADLLLKDCIDAISASQNREKIEDLQAKMIRLENNGDAAGALAVLREIQERLKSGEK